MAENVDILVRLRGARQASHDADRVAHSLHGIGGNSAAATAPLIRASKATDKMAKSSGAAASAAGGFAGRLGGLAKGGVAGAAIAGVYGLGKFVKSAASEYTEAARVTALTNNALKTNGKLAGINANQIEKLAGSLSLKAGVDDDAIQSGANLLLTFKAVRNSAGKGNDTFTQATKTALDMSAAYGTPLRNTFIQLGKALQDPVKGAAALKKVGAISAKDIVDLKAMDKAGKSVKAQQKFILDAVNKSRVKGAAAAQAQPIDKLKVAWGELAESVGKKFAPMINKAVGGIATFVNGVMSGKGAGGRFAAGATQMFKDFMAAIKPLVPFFRDQLIPAIGPTMKIVGVVISASIAGCIEILRQMVRSMVWLVGAVKTGAHGIAAAFQWIKTAVTDTTNWVRNSFNNLVGFVGGIPHRISSALKGIWDGLKKGFADAIRWIKDQWNSFADAFSIDMPGGGKIGIGGISTGGGKAAGITGMAAGGIVRSAGMAMVGERGPEILRLPRNARVDPLPKHGPMAPLNGGIIDVHSTIVLDGKEVAKSTARHTRAAYNRR